MEIKPVTDQAQVQEFFLSLDDRVKHDYTRPNVLVSQSYVFGAYEAGKMVALGHLDRYLKETKAHVLELGIVVHQNWQRQGIGWALMQHLLLEARKLGVEKINLRVFYDNKPAITLYRKLGFVVEGTFIKEEKWGNEYRTILSMAWFPYEVGTT